MDVRIARIEEGMVKIHGDLRAVHSDVKEVIKISRDNDRELTILSRDRFWLFTLCGFAFTTGAAALIEVLSR